MKSFKKNGVIILKKVLNQVPGISRLDDKREFRKTIGNRFFTFIVLNRRGAIFQFFWHPSAVFKTVQMYFEAKVMQSFHAEIHIHCSSIVRRKRDIKCDNMNFFKLQRGGKFRLIPYIHSPNIPPQIPSCNSNDRTPTFWYR